MKIKIRPADKLFSNYIRARDKWTCQRCFTRYEPPTRALHCSHYFGRGRENTRFDEENCIALCHGCHQLWGHGDLRDDYTAYMEKRLGKQGFKNLKIRAYQYKKKDDKLIILWLTKLMKSQSN